VPPAEGREPLPTRIAIAKRLQTAFGRASDAIHHGACWLAHVRYGTDPTTGAVALTFDDGPDPSSTPKLLGLLEEHDVKATFFVTGRGALRYPDLVRRIAASGHAVGSHSLTHPFVATCGLREVAREYREGRRAVEGVLGRRCRLFRPPGSDLGYRSLLAMRRYGLRPWIGTVDPEDWMPGRTAGEVLRVLETATEGDVVILHDGIELAEDRRALDRSATLEAVGLLLANRSPSTRFVTLEVV
jgi:peptidoglycan-N-acetylglucosamine deacetylase